jgi:hypothetical protein
MDLYGALRELYEEKKRLDNTISALEASLVKKSAPAAKKRGRKAMSPEERLQVSERMRKYWESRKNAAEPSTPSASAGISHPAAAASGLPPQPESAAR